MTQLVPYFAGLVTIVFGAAFYIGLQEFRYIDSRHEERRKENKGIIEEPQERDS
jgi:hypothetical protein